MDSSRVTFLGLAAAVVVAGVTALAGNMVTAAPASPSVAPGQAIGGLACWSRTIVDERKGITCDEACARGGAACTGVNTAINPSGCDVRTGGPATCRCCRIE